MAKTDLGRGGRWVAAILAIVWIGAGAAVIVLSLSHERWAGVVLGLIAVVYGLVWVQVARTGRRLRWPRRGRTLDKGL